MVRALAFPFIPSGAAAVLIMKFKCFLQHFWCILRGRDVCYSDWNKTPLCFVSCCSCCVLVWVIYGGEEHTPWLGYSPSGCSLKEWQFSTRLFELLICGGSPYVTWRGHGKCNFNAQVQHFLNEWIFAIMSLRAIHTSCCLSSNYNVLLNEPLRRFTWLAGTCA